MATAKLPEVRKEKTKKKKTKEIMKIESLKLKPVLVEHISNVTRSDNSTYNPDVFFIVKEQNKNTRYCHVLFDTVTHQLQHNTV